MAATLVAEPVQAPPTWRVAAASFLPGRLRARATERWLPHLPLVLLLAAQVALTLRLSTSVFEDEAIYLDAGHDYLSHWFAGTALQDAYGSYFSGVPQVYPVLAALLDDVGGLSAVRGFSLLCLLVSTLCVRSVGRELWGARAGGLAAAAFVLSGPVLFLGDFATFDAPTLACLAVALWLGVVRRGHGSAVLAGLVLALAPVLKYTGAVFVPVVLAVVLFSLRRRRGRVLVAALVAGAALGAVYLAVGPSIAAGIEFTTSGRTAILWATTSTLLSAAGWDLGLLAAVAVLGAAVLARSVRSAMLALTLLAGGLLLPLAQLRLHEWVSFEKHLAWSALFLALLAGRGLLWVSRRPFGALLVGATICALAISGLAASHRMAQWTDVSHVVAAVEQLDRSGTYLSTSATQLGYYTDHDGLDLTWEPHYALYDSGTEAMQAAVADRTYAGFVVHDGSGADPEETAATAQLLDLLAGSDDYELVAQTPVTDGSTDTWLVFELVEEEG